MKILQVKIEGFRGIRQGLITFDDNTVLIGTNGCGKSTVMDALTLALGSIRSVRTLTDHDFYGSNPQASDRIKIIVTLTDFKDNNIENNQKWFREGRAIPKWWNRKEKKLTPLKTEDSDLLCMQLGFAARFDFDDLSVETIRYFHDDDSIVDPFNDETIVNIPNQLINDIGFTILPVIRSNDRIASFGSDLIRRTISRMGAIPSEPILKQKSYLCGSSNELFNDETFRKVINGISKQMSQLMPGKPELSLKLTSTDCDAIMQSLVPHYKYGSECELPAGRHGTGLLSMQTFSILMEAGQKRIENAGNFIFAMEEPELHIPPSLQLRMIQRAMSSASQIICTTHSPRVAAYFPPNSIRVINNLNGVLTANPLLQKPLDQSASNGIRKLLFDNRLQVVEAVMCPRVLIPEGRIDYELLRLLSETMDKSEVFGNISDPLDEETPYTFASIVGLIPTHNSQIKETYNVLRNVHNCCSVIVDGDSAGDNYISELMSVETPPRIIIQWPSGWTIEDVILWILTENTSFVFDEIKAIDGVTSNTIDEFKTEIKTEKGKGSSVGLKGNYLFYEALISFICNNELCLKNARKLMNGLVEVLYDSRYSDNFEKQSISNDKTLILRWKPW